MVVCCCCSTYMYMFVIFNHYFFHMGKLLQIWVKLGSLYRLVKGNLFSNHRGTDSCCTPLPCSKIPLYINMGKNVVFPKVFFLFFQYFVALFLVKFFNFNEFRSVSVDEHLLHVRLFIMFWLTKFGKFFFC
jgi:hypothetical protein